MIGTLLIFGIVLVLIVVVYALWGRTWLHDKPWAQGFIAWIEPIEITLWKKSETILFARFKMIVGVALTVLTQMGAIDITPLMPFVPDKYEPLVRLGFNMLPLILTMLGAIDERLRRDTSTPLEVVALPDKVIAESPKLAEAVAAAEVAKVEAVAVVKTVVAENAADVAKADKPKDGD